MKNKKLQVVSLLPKSMWESWANVTMDWNKYFNIEYKVDTPEHFKKYLGKPIDILFIHSDADVFEMQDYKRQQDVKNTFKYVLVQEKEKAKDFMKYKGLADDIVYTHHERNAKWKLIALLRRFWNEYSNRKNAKIYKNIVIDFMERKVYLSNKLVKLTSKEFELLKFMVNNVGKYMTKKEIFSAVWDYEEDTSRALEQIIFKLKSKIGKDYFTLSRKLGYKFE